MSQTVTLSQTTAGEIRAEMARQRISATNLAHRLGWSDFYIGRRLRGQVSLNLQELEQVADALNVPISQLLQIKPLTAQLPARRPVAA